MDPAIYAKRAKIRVETWRLKHLKMDLVPRLIRRFGLGWYYGGVMSANLTGIVWADDTVTTCGTITDVTREGAHTRSHLTVWGEKNDGTLALVGTASALSDEF